VSPIVSTQWLADHIGSEGLVVLDATVLPEAAPSVPSSAPSLQGGSGWRSGVVQYREQGHVPGAVFADLLGEFSAPSAGRLFARPSRERFEAAASSAGVDNDTTVVVYDSDEGQWAARIWWLFRTFGYDRVAVLDGGYAKWFGENRPIDLGEVAPREAVFVGLERPELWADRGRVERIAAGKEPGSLVFAGRSSLGAGSVPVGASLARTGAGSTPVGASSARAGAGSTPVGAGSAPVGAGPARLGAMALAGERPSGAEEFAARSLHVPVARLRDPESKTMLKTAALRERFATVLDGSPIVTHCGAGIAAAADALALTLLGVTDVAVYDGSLADG
jgi:thiosulfate/3-mercaptopyruvate sulfurtransferase